MRDCAETLWLYVPSCVNTCIKISASGRASFSGGVGSNYFWQYLEQSVADKSTVDFHSMDFDQVYTNAISLKRYWCELRRHIRLTSQLFPSTELEAILDDFWPFLRGSAKWQTLLGCIFCMEDHHQVAAIWLNRVLKYNQHHITLFNISP